MKNSIALSRRIFIIRGSEVVIAMTLGHLLPSRTRAQESGGEAPGGDEISGGGESGSGVFSLADEQQRSILASGYGADDEMNSLLGIGKYFLGSDRDTATLASVGASGVLGIDYEALIASIGSYAMPGTYPFAGTAGIRSYLAEKAPVDADVIRSTFGITGDPDVDRMINRKIEDYFDTSHFVLLSRSDILMQQINEKVENYYNPSQFVAPLSHSEAEMQAQGVRTVQLLLNILSDVVAEHTDESVGLGTAALAVAYRENLFPVAVTLPLTFSRNGLSVSATFDATGLPGDISLRLKSATAKFEISY